MQRVCQPFWMMYSGPLSQMKKAAEAETCLRTNFKSNGERLQDVDVCVPTR